MTWFRVDGVCARRRRCIRIPAIDLAQDGTLAARLDATLDLFRRSETRDLIIRDLVGALAERDPEAVPAQANPIAFRYDPARSTFLLYLEHPSFDVVPEGAHCPEFGLAPSA